MSKAGSYPQVPFKTSQGFLAQDPSRSQVVRVSGNDLLDAAVTQLLDNGNAVVTIDTRTEAIAFDYASGQYVLTSGETAIADGGAAIYRVVDAGTGGIPMDNGNELLLIMAPGVTSRSDIGGLALLNGAADQQISIKGWHPDSDVGGGIFYWDAAANKNTHNGGTIIDPDAPFPTDYNDATQIATFLNFTGTGAGVWVRIYEELDLSMFGAKGDGVIDDTAPVQALVDVMPTQGGTFLALPGDYLTPSTVNLNGKTVKAIATGNITLEVDGISIQESGNNFAIKGWSNDSPRNGFQVNRIDLGRSKGGDAVSKSAVNFVDGFVENNTTGGTATREVIAYGFDLETDQADTSSVIRGMNGVVRANGGESTARAVRVLAEGTNGHTGELTGVLSTVIHTDLNTANPAPYNPVSGTAFQAELGAGSERGFLATGWPGQSRPSYGFVSGTGTRAILPEIAHFMAHGGGNGDMFAATVDENTAGLSFGVDNQGSIAARSFCSGVVIVNDDEVQTINPPKAVGFLEIWTTSAASQVYGKVFFKAAASPFNTECYKGTLLDLSTATLTGTTGTDGNVTLSSRSDGTIQIENRNGVARGFVLAFTCEANTTGTYVVP